MEAALFGTAPTVRLQPCIERVDLWTQCRNAEMNQQAGSGSDQCADRVAFNRDQSGVVLPCHYSTAAVNA